MSIHQEVNRNIGMKGRLGWPGVDRARLDGHEKLHWRRSAIEEGEEEIV